MPPSDRTVAKSPFVVSSRPTVGLTISAAWRLKLLRLPLRSASSICCAVVLSDVPASAPTCGTWIIT